jgi:hypothetical protein
MSGAESGLRDTKFVTKNYSNTIKRSRSAVKSQRQTASYATAYYGVYGRVE